MQISIDAINDMYLNQNIDQFIIMSNDKDMSPLLNTIKSNKRKAILLTVGTSYDYALCNVPDEHISIEEIWKEQIKELYLNKFHKKILENIEDYYINQNPLNKQLELEYCISNQMAYRHIMKYELLNIFRILQDEGELFIYEYEFRQKSYYGVSTSSIREKLINSNLINKDKIIKYNFTTRIDDLYEKVAQINN